MNLFVYAIVLVAALSSKGGQFSVWAGKKYTVTVIESEHTSSIGKFSLAQAQQIATNVARGNASFSVRFGADDYTFTVTS